MWYLKAFIFHILEVFAYGWSYRCDPGPGRVSGMVCNLLLTELLQKLPRLSLRIGIAGLGGSDLQVLLSAGGIASAPQDDA